MQHRDLVESGLIFGLFLHKHAFERMNPARIGPGQDQNFMSNRCNLFFGNRRMKATGSTRQDRFHHRIDRFDDSTVLKIDSWQPFAKTGDDLIRDGLDVAGDVMG